MIEASRNRPRPHHSLPSNLVSSTTTRGGTSRMRKIESRLGRLSIGDVDADRLPPVGILCHREGDETRGHGYREPLSEVVSRRRLLGPRTRWGLRVFPGRIIAELAGSPR